MNAIDGPTLHAAQGAQAEAVEPPIRVLLIEDDIVDELATLRTVAREHLPYQLQVARSVDQARNLLQSQNFDVILADYQLGDGTSFDLMDDFGDQLVIFITGAWDPTAAAQALRLGVHDYVIKDLEGQYLHLLHYRIETALRLRRLSCQLRASEARLQAILDNAPVSISAHDLSGRLILSNRHHAQHASAAALPDLTLPPPATPQESEETQTESDGSQYTYLTVRFAMPPTHGQGQVLGTIAVDITERCRANEALLLAKAAAEAANAAKSVFLSNISHEIRTPLNAVIGVTHLLAESGLNDDQRALLYKAQLAGRSLLGIINDVLDLSKIEAGEITLDEAPYQPVALLEEIEAVYAPQARKKGLNFTVTVSSDLPSWLQCDSSRLRQVLINLVANALKFTDRGGVDVQLSMTGRSLDRCGLLIRVRDSGIGIEPGIQERLFLPFIQADASTTRRYGGTGLGLSIVKRLVQIMGGEVGLTSTPGVGSEFWVALPQTLPGADQAESSSLGLMLLEVVVVDDNPLDRAFLASEVRALGWQALALDSGAALLEEWAARQSAGRALPDVVLVDWQMPGMDGLGTLATLAARAGPQDLPPVLMVTAYDSEHLQRLNHAGLVDHVLTKPLVPAALFNAVNQSLARRHGSTDRLLQSTRMDGSDTLWLADLRVLLVDDCDINLEVAKRLLEHRGARVRTCTGGHEALDCLRSAPADFDAVLMDVRMPDMDGLEVTRRLRSELGLVTLPVIALTAVALVEKRRRALDAGMQGFLSKPLDPVQLVRVLRGCVETARGTVLPVSGQGPRLDAVPVAWPLVGGIDADDVAARLGHDVALFSLLLRQLLREFQDLVSPPEPALASAEQRQALAARMHKLRGSAGTLGARDLHQLAEVAETSLQAFGDSRASAAVHCVSQALVRLAEQSADVLAAAHRSAPAAGSGASGPAPATAWAAPDKVRGLLRQLKSQDLAAIDSFKDLLPGLSEVLGAQATDRLSAAMDALDFAQVLELLGESPQSVQPTHDRTEPGPTKITDGYSAADTARDTGHIGLAREC